MRRSLYFVLVLLTLATCTRPALAQSGNATLRGTVTDQSGAVVPGATVTVTNPETGLVRTVVTNESGAYVASELLIGQYTVAAELSGFKTQTRTGVRLRVADDYRVDFVLEPGDVTEVVTVAATSTPVKVLGGDVSGVVTGQQVRELPLNGRNFLQLATLMPGVSAPDSLNMKDKGLLSGSDMSVSGGDVTGNLWTVDGANNNDVGSNRTILVYPSLDAIEEFKILRNSYGPEFGGAGGGQVNIVTRGGTNQYRGSAFYSFRNDALNATDYFLKEADQPKGQLKRNDFGGSFGGPIIKDKLFFFGALEWNIEDRGTTRTGFVPTELERQGNFSGPSIPGCTSPIPVDPLTGQPFPGNTIPADRLSAGGLNYLKLYPLPNVTPAGGSCNNWVTSLTSPIRYSNWSLRGDWAVSNSSRIMVRYTQDSWKNNGPSVYTNLWGDDQFPQIDSNWDQPSRSFITSLSQTLGSTSTNTVTFSYSGNAINIDRYGDTDLNAAILQTIPTIFPTSTLQYGDQTGHPVFWGQAGYSALWNEAPFRNNQDLYIVKDDYTRVFGKHLVKAGVLASWNAKNEDTNGNGSAQNSTLWGGAPYNGWGGPSGTGNVLADFLLKDMTWGFTAPSSGRQNAQRWRDLEFYAADSWQVSPKLTLDYGFRYSIYYNPYVTDDTIMSFVPELFNPALGNDPCNGLLQVPGSNWCGAAGARGGTDGPNRSLMNQDYNNIAPRVGMAWDIHGNGKSAIRAGIGQFFQRERLSPTLNIASNPPFVRTITGLRKLDTAAEPCDGCFGSGIGAPGSGREVDQITPNTWQYNVMYQQEVWRNTTIEVGYVGARGRNLLRTYVASQVLPGDIDGNGVDDRLQYVTTQPSNAALRQFGVFGDTNIGVWVHDGKSEYDSLQTQFISRFGQGSQLQISYTLARSRANMALTSSDGSIAANTTQLDNTNPDLDWGRPETGRTNIFSAALVWMLPMLDNRSGLTQAVLGGWQFNTIVGAATGQPFTAYAGGLPGLNGGPMGTGYGNNQRVMRTDASCTVSGGLPEQIINPAAYTLVGYQLGQPGSATRGDCTGPGYFQTDVGFYKNFTLTGRTKLQFRWDIFNVFNTTNFSFAGINSTMTPSSITLNPAGNAIVGESIPSNFGQATRTRDPMQMQIGFKLMW